MKRVMFLARKDVLWGNFLTLIVLTAIFGLVMQHWGFEIIDEMSDPDAILAHVEVMSSKQRLVHAWLTGTVDVVYPFIYGGLFIGMALRAFGRAGPLLALPSLVVIPFDLVEGYVQVQLLTGDPSLVWLKQIVTPAKLALFFAGIAISIVGLLKLLRQRYR